MDYFNYFSREYKTRQVPPPIIGRPCQNQNRITRCLLLYILCAREISNRASDNEIYASRKFIAMRFHLQVDWIRAGYCAIEYLTYFNRSLCSLVVDFQLVRRMRLKSSPFEDSRNFTVVIFIRRIFLKPPLFNIF